MRSFRGLGLVVALTFAQGCAADEACSPVPALRLATDGSCVQPVEATELLECEGDPRKATAVFCVRDATGTLLLALVKQGNVLELGDAVPQSLLTPQEQTQCEEAKQRYMTKGGAFCDANGASE